LFSKSQLISIFSVRDRAALNSHRMLEEQTKKIKGSFATRAAPAFWRGTFDSHLKSTQKRFFKQAAGSGAFSS